MLYRGHNIILAGGYPAIYTNGKVVRIHILEMEKILGRKLKKGECVHHKDENRLNYDSSNLLCFRSNSDHVAFHNGCDFVLDDEGIAYCPNKGANRMKCGKSVYKHCPKCGGLMSATSSVCLNCYKQTVFENSRCPDKDVLQDLISSGKNLTQIGRQFGVTGNAVKKWLKHYDIAFSFRFCPPDRSTLVSDLKSSRVSDIAKAYGVSKDTIHFWMSNYGIKYIPAKVKCVETDQVFDSMLKAADVIYPSLARKSVGNFIHDVIDTDRDYHGYHWVTVEKEVS